MASNKTFEIPEGVYSATLDEVKEVRKPTSEGIAVYARFLWRIDALARVRRLGARSPLLRVNIADRAVSR